MRLLIFILFLSGILVCCQEKQKEHTISSFVQDLFDHNVNANDVYTKYIKIDENIASDFTLDERKQNVIAIINETRTNKEDLGWLIPKSEIRNIKNPKIFPFTKKEHLSKIALQFDHQDSTLMDRIYVLTNDKEDEILQYFLLNADKDAIQAFTLFVKSENQAWFFGF